MIISLLLFVLSNIILMMVYLFIVYLFKSNMITITNQLRLIDMIMQKLIIEAKKMPKSIHILSMKETYLTIHLQELTITIQGIITLKSAYYVMSKSEFIFI